MHSPFRNAVKASCWDCRWKLAKFGVCSIRHFNNIVLSTGLIDLSTAHRHTDRETERYRTKTSPQLTLFIWRSGARKPIGSGGKMTPGFDPPPEIYTGSNMVFSAPDFLERNIFWRTGQLILGKIIKIVATSCQTLRLKCAKFDFGWRLPRWI